MSAAADELLERARQGRLRALHQARLARANVFFDFAGPPAEPRNSVLAEIAALDFRRRGEDEDRGPLPREIA